MRPAILLKINKWDPPLNKTRKSMFHYQKSRKNLDVYLKNLSQSYSFKINFMYDLIKQKGPFSMIIGDFWFIFSAICKEWDHIFIFIDKTHPQMKPALEWNPHFTPLKNNKTHGSLLRIYGILASELFLMLQDFYPNLLYLNL